MPCLIVKKCHRHTFSSMKDSDITQRLRDKLELAVFDRLLRLGLSDIQINAIFDDEYFVNQFFTGESQIIVVDKACGPTVFAAWKENKLIWP